MILDWALLATHAEQQANGAFAILGAGIENLPSTPRADLPAEAQNRIDPAIVGSDVTFHIVARFKLPRHELSRTHLIEADVVDDDGRSVNKLTLNVPPLAMPAGAGHQNELGVVTHLQLRLSPTKFGSYTVALYADTAPVKQIPFQILAHHQPGTAGPAPPGAATPG
jgi:hypothetical protein